MKYIQTKLSDTEFKQLKLAALDREIPLFQLVHELIMAGLGTSEKNAAEADASTELEKVPPVPAASFSEKINLGAAPLRLRPQLCKNGHPILRGNKCSMPKCSYSAYA